MYIMAGKCIAYAIREYSNFILQLINSYRSIVFYPGDVSNANPCPKYVPLNKVLGSK